MQSLLLKNRLFGAINSGMKRVTIRAGHWSIKTGPLTFESHDGTLHANVTVTSVRMTKAKDLLPSEYRAEGCESAEEAIKKLRKYYPGMTGQTPVTVIFFTRG